MAGWDGAGSIHALRTRITRLAATGAPAVSASAYVVTDALVKASWTPQYVEGEEIEQLNGGGELCVHWKAPRVLKAAEVSIEFCTPDPLVEELLSGGAVILDVATPIGYKAPDIGVDPMPNGVSIEFWSRAVIDGAPAASTPYIQWILPRVKDLGQDEQTLENAAHNPVFSGSAGKNTGWAPPADTWTYGSDRIWQWARVASLPAVTDGYAAVAAP